MLRLVQDLVEGLRMARSALRANPLRSALTMLGIIIGIVTVTLMSAFVTGIHDSFHNAMSFMGADVYYIDKHTWQGGNWMMQRNRPNLTIQDAHELEKRMTTARAVSVGASEWSVKLKYGTNEIENIRASGADRQYEVTNSLDMDQGRFFGEQELASARPVCVIGYDVWDQLFHKSNPIGKTMRVNGYPLEVVGVAKRAGGMFGFWSVDHEIILPLQTFFSAFGEPNRTLTIAVKAKSILTKEDTKAEADYQMRMIRGLKPGEDDNFGINSEDSFNVEFDKLTTTLQMIGLVITGLSLLVGGIGIMNIMFVSVKERTREIGIRKAIGARRRMILAQFLTEASMLCIIAGTIGLLIAFAASAYINHSVLGPDSTIQVHLSLMLITSGLGISLGIGVVSGILPAWRASKLDPVDALRYE
jgi:putative ABC transport system permease protein